MGIHAFILEEQAKQHLVGVFFNTEKAYNIENLITDSYRINY